MTEIEENLERYLEQLAACFQEDEEQLLAAITVNASAFFDYDDYGNPTLVLELPKEIYLRCRDNINGIESSLCSKYNEIIYKMDHHIIAVKLTIKKPEGNWREIFSVYNNTSVTLAPSDELRIWKDTPLKVFFSYTEDKIDLIKDVKNNIESRGITCFVAKTDVLSSLPWADEIKKALRSADVFVAFLTERFHESDWTEQEMGFAICRGITLILINLGTRPHGFTSGIQMLPECDTNELPDKLFHELMKYIDDEDALRKLSENSAVFKLTHAGCYDDANEAAKSLYQCSGISSKHVTEIITAYNSNRQIREAFEINGVDSPSGKIKLIDYLERTTGKKYHIVSGILSVDNSDTRQGEETYNE